MKDGGAPVIHINFQPAEVDPVYFPQLDVIGDLATSINRLSDALSPQSNWDFSYFYRVKQEVQQRLGLYSDDDRFPILPQSAVTTIRAALGEKISWRWTMDYTKSGLPVITNVMRITPYYWITRWQQWALAYPQQCWPN